MKYLLYLAPCFRVEHFGEYSSNECGIEVRGVNTTDSGTWECEVFLSNVANSDKYHPAYRLYQQINL
jgi:hypothetical protein